MYIWHPCSEMTKNTPKKGSQKVNLLPIQLLPKSGNPDSGPLKRVILRLFLDEINFPGQTVDFCHIILIQKDVIWNIFSPSCCLWGVRILLTHCNYIVPQIWHTVLSFYWCFNLQTCTKALARACFMGGPPKNNQNRYVVDVASILHCKGLSFISAAGTLLVLSFYRDIYLSPDPLHSTPLFAHFARAHTKCVLTFPGNK